eukprot:TRINITY_DN45375_c0_g1_i1.p1 TRINITY_DN45375_c0_g1~~TRINITY_DN45375_c0_g1_i1.p1  ORF type:complete len:260 (+),score=7.35 TRINITY_DN45375_c0_g1_i1:87-782(+)
MHSFGYRVRDRQVSTAAKPDCSKMHYIATSKKSEHPRYLRHWHDYGGDTSKDDIAWKAIPESRDFILVFETEDSSKYIKRRARLVLVPYSGHYYMSQIGQPDLCLANRYGPFWRNVYTTFTLYNVAWWIDISGGRDKGDCMKFFAGNVNNVRCDPGRVPIVTDAVNQPQTYLLHYKSNSKTWMVAQLSNHVKDEVCFRLPLVADVRDSHDLCNNEPPAELQGPRHVDNSSI